MTEPEVNKVNEAATPALHAAGHGHGLGWVWAVAVGGVVLSLILACVVGAAAGWVAGRKAAGTGVTTVIPWSQWQQGPETPNLPQLPRRLQTPVAPNQRQPLQGLTVGALVRGVTPNTPAEQAGIAPGDIILRVDDKPLASDMSLSDLIGQYRPGDRVTLLVWRGGNARSVDVVLGQHPDDATRGYLGVTVVQATVPSAFERSTD
jgi:S1-C subfamily serine protease